MYRNGSARGIAASAGGQKIEITTLAATSPPPTSQKMAVRVDRIHAGYRGCSNDRRAATSCLSTNRLAAHHSKPSALLHWATSAGPGEREAQLSGSCRASSPTASTTDSMPWLQFTRQLRQPQTLDVN